MKTAGSVPTDGRRALAVLPAAVALAAALLTAPAPAAAQDDERRPRETVGGEWLVLPSVDARGRQPFNADAVFARYLLDLPVIAPREGERVRGSSGEPASWTAVNADAKGWVAGRFRWAYRALESAEDRVVLAHLPGGGALFVNDLACAGDVYGLKAAPVPVLLRKGTNHVFVRGVRRRFRLMLEAPQRRFEVVGADHTLPDVLRGAHGELEAGVAIANTDATDWGAPPVFDGTVGLGRNRPVVIADGAAIETLPPLHTARVPVPFSVAAELTAPGADGDPPKETSLGVILTHVARPPEDEFDVARVGLHTRDLPLRVVEPGDVRLVTFRSAIDDSVQTYAVRPTAGPARGLVLTLHGAGVRARGQARAYGQKDDLWIVAPTNRRPFGFDWQDWGRTDAYEALDHALEWTGAPNDAVYLTGHSMGGHGTWHLAANDADRFRAIAPSAGWSQFDHYGGRPRAARREPWLGADRASDTLSLASNLAQIPTFVLHGEDDDNVPVSEARRMLDAVRAAGGTPQHHFEPGVKHWWDGDPAPGAACVDWPGIFELFAAAPPRGGDSIAFTSVDPAVDAEHGFVRVEQVLRYGRPFRVTSERLGDVVHVDTENVRLLRVRSTTRGTASVFVLDGATVHKGPEPEMWFRRETAGGEWTVVIGPAIPPQKSPWLSGPFKRAFGNRFVMVVGTQGTEVENAALLARARFDAQTWGYRGNGRATIVRDTSFAGADLAGRNVILYGNADTNGAWETVLGSGEGAHIEAQRGRLRVGETTYEGDAYAAIFVRPRRNVPSALVGAFADTGAPGSRLGYALLTFVSGVGYPDWTVFSPAVLHAGTDGVLEAGWYDYEWNVQAD